METILVVDDDKALRMIVSYYLGTLGYQVSDKADAKSALDFLRQGERVDLVIIDYHMPPGMNGIELMEHLKSFYSFIPCVLMSADTDENLPALAIKEGFKGFVEKSVGNNGEFRKNLESLVKKILR